MPAQNEMFDEAVAHYAAALEVTRSFGVKIIVEMHGGTLHPSASLAHRIVSNFSSDDIGVICQQLTISLPPGDDRLWQDGVMRRLVLASTSPYVTGRRGAQLVTVRAHA